jgi:AraC family transcriptional regulator of arabinose operon
MPALHTLMSEIDVSVGTITYPPGGTLGPRRQRDVQLVLVHTGSVVVRVDGEPHRLDAGEVGLLVPGHEQRFAFDRAVATRHSWVQVHTPEPPIPLAGLPRKLPISPALDVLVREAVAGSALPTAQPVRAHLAVAALWRYAGEAERRRPERSAPVDEARRFIDSHLADPGVALPDVARAAHVTPAHLIRVFRSEHATTPIAFLWERRTALGVDLLTHTGLPIEVVAARCGFRTAHHFSRRVKQATGLPPGALRRARWGD